MIFKSSYEVIEAIEIKKKNGIELASFKSFMESIDNPQHKLKCIHVGGTNGKGSTVNALSNILRKAGYRVGTFTSPYLETHHDRIRINDEFIADQSIVDYANAYYDKWKSYDLSMFEIDMFIATQYFIDYNVDIAIFEVGLGGDQDATNIINPMVSVITNIGLDHMEFLGDTYTDIAYAKAGIIKAGKALITAEKSKECLDVFKSVCVSKGSQLIECEAIENVYVDTKLHFDYHDFHIDQNVLAAYQAQNSALAIETILYLKKHNFINVSESNIVDGIANSVWKGRFEVVSSNPLVIIDGAHNEEGIRALVDSCQNYDNIRILFSALTDKPYAKMLDALFEISDDITVCEFDFPRAAKAEVIAGNHDVNIIKDYKEAIECLLQGDGVLLICGSLYFIAEVRNYFIKKGESAL